MHRLEELLEIPHMSRRSYFYQDGKYVVPANLQVKGRNPPKEGFLERAGSYKFWLRGVGVFAVVNFGILATELFWPWLLHPVVP